MYIIPAIDIKNGACVRLKQGRMTEVSHFGTDPLEFANKWLALGAKRLHLVDLDGAVQGKTVNMDLIRQISANHSTAEIQIGGGIRTLASIETYLDAGARFVIIGTQAVKQPDFVKEACKLFPGHIIVGIDAKNGLVATEGWYEVSTLVATDLAKQLEQTGVTALIYTDIHRDGMMQGVNLTAIKNMLEQTSVDLIASGGITTMQDIKNLCQLKPQGLVGAITGRAIYEGRLDLQEALDYVGAYPS